MHAAVQSGGRSPKQLNGPSASQQLKTAPDGTQNCGLSKGKKREREVSKELIQLSGIEIVCLSMTVSLEASWTI